MGIFPFSFFFQLVTGVWEGKYNFFCQGTRSGGEADMKVLSLIKKLYKRQDTRTGNPCGHFIKTVKSHVCT